MERWGKGWRREERKAGISFVGKHVVMEKAIYHMYACTHAHSIILTRSLKYTQTGTNTDLDIESCMKKHGCSRST